jgi:hypothetical protein
MHASADRGLKPRPRKHCAVNYAFRAHLEEERARDLRSMKSPDFKIVLNSLFVPDSMSDSLRLMRSEPARTERLSAQGSQSSGS